MNKYTGHYLSFGSLDREKGIPDSLPAEGEEFPLPAWYRSVREVPLEKLGIEDICKACRQQIHLDHVVSLAVGLLHSDPLSGELYEGELLVALRSVPTNFWTMNQTEANQLIDICETLRVQINLEDDLSEQVNHLLKSIRASEMVNQTR